MTSDLLLRGVGSTSSVLLLGSGPFPGLNRTPVENQRRTRCPGHQKVGVDVVVRCPLANGVDQ